MKPKEVCQPKENKLQQRKIKIYSKHVPRSNELIVVPEIRLCGKWLNDLGFIHGHHVEVVCEEGRIIITKV